VDRWVAERGAPRHDADGRFGGYTGSCADITERLEAEQAAHEFNERLINAQEEERARVARELHDDVSQRLARLAMDLGRLQRVPARDVRSDELIDSVCAELTRLGEDVHALSYELHPSVLVDLGLDAALKGECERFSKHTALPIALRLRDLPQAVPRNLALGLFRITQESLRNAIRHGRAGRIEVTLWGVEQGLQLAVRDDGIGFDLARHRQHHLSLGLASMRERARLLGGEFDIDSEPGHGTTVIVWVPLAEKSP
jgi:signal transduction histidine kinase